METESISRFDDLVEAEKKSREERVLIPLEDTKLREGILEKLQYQGKIGWRHRLNQE